MHESVESAGIVEIHDANIIFLMTHNEFYTKLQQKMTEINSFIQKDVPRIIGKTSVDFFKENFINQGFTDRGLEKWQPAKRTLYRDKNAASQYGTLLSLQFLKGSIIRYMHF